MFCSDLLKVEFLKSLPKARLKSIKALLALFFQLIFALNSTTNPLNMPVVFWIKPEIKKLLSKLLLYAPFVAPSLWYCFICVSNPKSFGGFSKVNSFLSYKALSAFIEGSYMGVAAFLISI